MAAVARLSNGLVSARNGGTGLVQTLMLKALHQSAAAKMKKPA
ncbi:hypothetical protein HMPREF0758_2911 [Serratia odorifera DSM 4582]|uniref:Uncharacterized protein n=1 Tax=Serratia odorifera DSM 4582 TaxID=667129 RepID=D4E411_SEROD|nr:hypothetical protein HMPREF0758_2911 [Serratia odorifera DSM 4582]